VDHAATMHTQDDAESALAIHPNSSNFLHLTFGQRFGTIAIIVIDPSGSLDGKPHALVSKPTLNFIASSMHEYTHACQWNVIFSAADKHTYSSRVTLEYDQSEIWAPRMWNLATVTVTIV
jgi:hypothetical protein